MMKLWIKVSNDNEVIDHPHFEENLVEVYGPKFTEMLPNDGTFRWMPFVRIEPPVLREGLTFNNSIGADKCDGFSHNGLSYEISDKIVYDHWHIIEEE
tara:strand:+ start:264 stop:557 length:294 start_codon:yes stop_codon:yes gene_type:complete